MTKARLVPEHRSAHERDVEKLWPIQIVALMVAYRRAHRYEASSPEELASWAQDLDAHGQAIDLFKVFDDLSLDEQAYVRQQLSSRRFESAVGKRCGIFKRLFLAIHRSRRN